MIGLTFTLFIFVYTCASSSVYAKTLRDMPTENGTIAEPDEEELADSPYLSQDALVAQDTLSEPTALLVQSLTMAQASPSILYQDADYDSFFEHTVFVGDSLTVGFTNYCQSRSDTMATASTYFLAKTSCSAKIALSGNALTTHAKVMPSYNGKVQYIEDSISQMTDVQRYLSALV